MEFLFALSRYYTLRCLLHKCLIKVYAGATSVMFMYEQMFWQVEVIHCFRIPLDMHTKLYSAG